MPRALLLVAALAGLFYQAGHSATREAPSYSASSIVNSASNQPGAAAPNSFVTIYGKNLAYTTRAIADSDLRERLLPTILPGTGVTVYLNHIRTQIFYVSPDQINVLIPADAYVGAGSLRVNLDGIYGPAIAIDIQAASPALFQLDAQTAIGTHVDGTLLTPAAPGKPGELVILYATGLGETVPPLSYGEIPKQAARLKESARFRVYFDGVGGDPARVAYVGVAPGFAGLYQINVWLPEDIGSTPQIRLQAGDGFSKPGVYLPVLSGSQ